MGYRFEDIPPAKPEDFLPVFDMTNNEKRIWSIPCFYFNVEKPIDWHDHKIHDYLGWPDPHNPDEICQALPDYEPYAFSPAAVWKYIDMNVAIPIHLLSDYEGYNVVPPQAEIVEVIFDGVDENGDPITIEGITCEGSIRNPEDWIVDILFWPQLLAFAGKPKEFLFNVFLNHFENNQLDRRDLLLRGKLVVLPG